MEFEGNVYVYKELKKKNYWFMLKYGVGLKYVCLFCLLCDFFLSNVNFVFEI